ncbi:MAG: sigma-54-dependent Fis family transcriptional regulator [Deltaproteobacteria bacterium]|nr:sigma-54-dependent Fis family transcriptional regulator [bacterium]MCB9478207.1 sigma-54-dependent Fis family transcriptional regulator [Deltaproteobacteria bacterium]MCB9487240.1 sigma-54-dependent Fis family transcriptional regulator [Deltaproteobacteria bacterium]
MNYHGKVLVADDEINMREALDLTLSRIGFTVVTATDGHEAIAKLHGSDEYRLLVTDVNMPKANGMDVLAEAVRLRPGLPVIVITGFGTIQNAVDAMKAGAADYIVKPFNADALEAAIAKHVKDPVAAIHDVTPQATSAKGKSGDGIAHAPDKPFLTKDPQTLKIVKIAAEIAKTDATVLIEGESGTGKEVLARLIHNNSPRKSAPFVAVNCAAVPANLLESELFGHEKGAFTGAMTGKKGKFEMADGGTILLDEIGEMEAVLQSKLLRVLQEREIDRIGGSGPRAINVRVVCTTNANLPKLVAEGKFREDLFYRLNVIPLTLPPLRERSGDVEILAAHFAEKFARHHGRAVPVMSAEALESLKKNPWKGNVRELSNTIERALLLTSGDEITSASLSIVENRSISAVKSVENPTDATLPTGLSLKELERQMIMKTLDEQGGNRTQTAKTLGISIRTLRNKLHEYGEMGGDDSDDAEAVNVAS